MSDELLARVDRLEGLFFESPVVTHAFLASGEYAVTYMSRNVERLLGYSVESFTNSQDFWLSHIHPDDKNSVLRNFRKLFDFGHHVQEYRFRHADGTWRWMREELRLVREASGEPREIIGSWTDISALTQARDEAMRAAMFGVYRYMNKILQELINLDAAGEDKKNVEAMKQQCIQLVQSLGLDLEEFGEIENVTWERVEYFVSHHF